jgi:hypothetical protein
MELTVKTHPYFYELLFFCYIFFMFYIKKYCSCYFDYVLGVRAHLHVDMETREHVKILVLLRRDMYDGDVDPTVEAPSKKRKFEGGSSGPHTWGTTEQWDELD